MLGGNIFEETVECIETWNPGNYDKEPGYQENLFNYLRENLGGNTGFGLGAQKPQVEKEGRRKQIDIMVNGGEVCIELKHGFRTNADIDRLRRQARKNLKRFGNIVIVFVGNTDSTKKSKMEKARRELNDELESLKLKMPGKRLNIKIIDKTGKKAKSKKKKESNRGFGLPSPQDFDFKI